MDIDPVGLERTVEDFNRAVQTGVPYNPAIKDGRGAVAIDPPKTNWAQTIDTPPYLGYAVTCGITFTFGGVKINNRAQVVTNSQEPIPAYTRRARWWEACFTTTTLEDRVYRPAWCSAVWLAPARAGRRCPSRLTIRIPRRTASRNSVHQ